MGYTNGSSFYAALHEDGINKFLSRVHLVRPRYFRYATKGFANDSPDITLVPPLIVPGTEQAVEYSLELDAPRIDFFPGQGSSTIEENQFSLILTVHLCTSCGLASLFNARRESRKLLASSTEELATKRFADPTVCATLTAEAIGQPGLFQGKDDKEIGLTVKSVKLSNTGDLQNPFDCLSSIMLNGMLSKTRLAVTLMASNVFRILVTDGPKINENQLKVWAGIQLRS